MGPVEALRGGVLLQDPQVDRPRRGLKRACGDPQGAQAGGAVFRSTSMNARIHPGWSGHARADTSTPSVTAFDPARRSIRLSARN